jgi:A/G-specific adenine glycosylase
VLRWHGSSRVDYPWRDPCAASVLPYRVLVSEIMLQQTQAARVAPAFERFVERFPSVAALAAAPRSEVLGAWAGLGYNRRAVALSKAAREIVRRHGGRIPSDLVALQALPGVGPYTAAAVVSIAFGLPAPAVDVNVRRVVARAVLGMDAGAADPGRVQQAATLWLDPKDPGRWNEALMDLGRTTCRPEPVCGRCPLRASCRFRASGAATEPPVRRQSRFEGSFRQVRGALIRELRLRPEASVGALARATGQPVERVAGAVATLATDGLVDAGPAALAGRRRGRVRLAR